MPVETLILTLPLDKMDCYVRAWALHLLLRGMPFVAHKNFTGIESMVSNPLRVKRDWAGVKKCCVRSLHTWVSPSFEVVLSLRAPYNHAVVACHNMENSVEPGERWSPPPHPRQLGQRLWPWILQNAPQLSPAQYPSGKCTGFTHLTKEMMLVHFRQSGTGQKKRKRDTLKMFVSPPQPGQGVDGWERHPSLMGPGNWQSKVAKRVHKHWWPAHMSLCLLFRLYKH
jgi:hypothetical protein